jgi:hypothetical protein
MIIYIGSLLIEFDSHLIGAGFFMMFQISKEERELNKQRRERYQI